MKNSKSAAVQFFICTAAVAGIYVGLRSMGAGGYDFTEPPDIILTNGRIAIPGEMTSVAFVRGTAMDVAAEIFSDAEDDPTLDEFLTTFFCNACSRNCLLLTPRCVAGRLRNNQAIEIFREMYPHVEIFA
jgi:hypothetical protein